MKIINIILLIFQSSSGDFYYFLQRGIVDEESERAIHGAEAECQDLPGLLSISEYFL